MGDAGNPFDDANGDREERPTIDSAIFTTNYKEDNPQGNAEATLDLLEESEDIVSYSSIPARPESKRGEVDDLQIPNQRWELFWQETSSKIHNEEVCGSIVNPKLDIIVSNPELVSSLMSKHIVYNVTTQPLGRNVRRRYNDFAWLRDALSTRYEGLYIPAIPATTAFSSKKSMRGKKTDIEGDFVKNRMHQLHLFMKQLSDIPFMRTDPSFILFLSIENEKEFKQVVESSANAAILTGSASEPKNEGLRLWHNLIDNVVVNPVEAEKCIADFKQQQEKIRTALDQIDDECRDLGKRAVNFARGMNSFSDVISKWAALEQGLLQPDQSKCLNSRSEEVKSTMDAFVYGQNHWSQGIMLMPKIIAWIIMSNVQYQLVQVHGFISHIQAREQLLKELEKAERDRVKALEDRHRSISPTRKPSTLFSKGSDELEISLQKKTELANKLQMAADRTTKALVFCELDRFNKERLHKINDLLSALAAVHMQMAQSTTTRWSEIASALGLDTESFDDIASGLSSTLDNDVFDDA